MGLKDFLVSTKAGQSDLQSRLKIHIVIGNESCDLDSTVCAITYAYFLHKTKFKLGTHILPVLCLPRDKFRVRLETVYFLQKHNILPDDLTFIDDVDLAALTRNELVTLSVTLVDHHVLSDAEECLGQFVTEVLDHRPVYSELPKSWNAQIETIGSCSTLVARKMLASEEFTIDETVAELLLGTILSDTGNMSASDNIGTPADHEVLVKLKSFLPPSISATSIYDEIRNSKFDLSSLTVLEMLHKDLKILKGTHITVAMSTITMDLEDLLSSPEFAHDASEFCLTLPADVVIIMTFVVGDSGISRRCIAVFSTSPVYREQLTDVLMSSMNPSLDLQPLNFPGHVENVAAFVQNNLRMSRKAVLPLVRDFLAGEMTTPEENINSSRCATQFSSLSKLESGSSGEKGDNSEEETRRHINLAKTFQSDQFRTSQDRFDLAAVGMDALISPSLSSDSDLGRRREGEDGDEYNDGLDDIMEEEKLGGEEGVAAAEGGSGPEQMNEAHLTNQSGAGDFVSSFDTVEDKSSQDVSPIKNEFVNDLIDFSADQSREPYSRSDSGALVTQPSVHLESIDLFSDNEADLLGLDLNGPVQDSNEGSTEIPSSSNLSFSQERPPHLSNSSGRDGQHLPTGDQAGIDDLLSPSDGPLPPGNIAIVNITESLLSDDVLQHHSPFDLLCPSNVDSPYDLSSMPASGQASGQGSKVPSYPDTPPNSYMELSGAVYYKETQLPSFNSSEMVKRIQAKKAALAGHSGPKRNFEDTDDADNFENLCVGEGGSSGGGGSLISPAVPQNSYMDLTSGFMSSDSQIPKLTNADIMDRVNEKRSKFEWLVESLDGSTSGVDAGPSSEEGPQNKSHTANQEIPKRATIDPQVPYTPQNSFVEGNFDAFARSSLPSMNSAEMVAKIRAKQSAMYGGSSSGRISRNSHGSDDSGGCRSPDVGAKSSRGASLDSPQPFTPQNSYKDSLHLMDTQNRLPDLNEVAERLSVEHSSKRHYGNNGVEDGVNINMNSQHPVRQARHSSSQSDSQNTMSDVESLMSVSTDVGTPSENIVASGLAGLMRNEIAMLSRKDTTDSDVFAPNKSDESASGNPDPKRSVFNHVDSPTKGFSEIQNAVPPFPDADLEVTQSGHLPNGFADKELFSPVEDSELRTVEDHAFFQAAESIVAQSVAAALQVSQESKGHTTAGQGGRLKWADNPVLNYIDDEDDHSSKTDETQNNDASDDDVSIHSDAGCNVMNSNNDVFISAGDFEVPVEDVMVVDEEAVNTEQHANGEYHPLEQPANSEYHPLEQPANSEYHPFEQPANGQYQESELLEVLETVQREPPEEVLIDQALNELAFEFARDLIQNVLNDFDEKASDNGIGLQNGLTGKIKKVGWQVPGNQVTTEQASTSGYSKSPPKNQKSGDPQKYYEHTSFGSSIDSEKYLASSVDSNSSASSAERRRSKDLSMTIVEGQIVANFPERELSAEIPTAESEEIMESFPGRKFSKSEDFPARRFSREENSSRRSSHMEDSDYENSIKPEDLETDYLPNMDPLQGNLDIIDASFTKITDVDREVVEGESFRKVSSEEYCNRSDEDEDEDSMEGYRRRLGQEQEDKEDSMEGYMRRLSKEQGDTQANNNGSVDWMEEPSVDVEAQNLINEGVEAVRTEIEVTAPTETISSDVQEEAQEDTFEEVKRAATKTRKKIRVSFSEDFDDEIGDFNIQSSSRSHLRSPPPPLHTQDSTSWSPPPLVEDFSEQDVGDEPLCDNVLSSPVTGEGRTPQIKRKEVFNTTAGRISVLGDDGDEMTSLPPTSLEDANMAVERAQVGKIIESAKETISVADHDLQLFDLPRSSPPSLEPTSLEPTSLEPAPLEPASLHPFNHSIPNISDHEHARHSGEPSLGSITTLSAFSIVAAQGLVNDQPTTNLEPLTGHVNTEPDLTSQPEIGMTFDPSAKEHERFSREPVHQQPQPVQPQPVTSDPLTSIHTHARNLSSTSFGSIKGAVYTEEWQDDDIQEMAAQSGIDPPPLDPHRKKIVPDSSFLKAIAADDDGLEEDEDEEDDAENGSDTGDLEWENDTPVKTPPRPGIEPAITQEGVRSDPGQARWKRVSVSGADFDIDLQAVEPFRNVLSHGGYYSEGLNAIIVFYGCHLPSRRREDYTYVMNHLFHYVIHTLEELVADDYVIIYFHGSTPRRQMPGLSWLKRCYQSIDRRLKKNLKGLFLVHPTLWLKTIVTMIRPFISSKFSSKLRFVRSLEDLNSLVPMANVTIPEAITQLEEILKHNPHYLEEQEEEEKKMLKEEEKEGKRKEKERKKQEKDRKKQAEDRKKQEAKEEKEKRRQEKEKEKERKKAEQKKKSQK